MIIGISGKLQVGKDLTGKIIQYLTAYSSLRFKHPITEQDFNSFVKNAQSDYSRWKIKKFADPLKDIACIIIGCTREQLEDSAFKEKELGEEWWTWKLRSSEKSNSYLIPYNKEYNLSDLYDAELTKLTPRLLLQLLGTDAGRNIIHPDIWVNSLMSQYKPYPQLYLDYDSLPNWIFTDVRFPNEAKAISDKNGILIRVNRKTYSEYRGKLVETFNVHPSETALDDYTFTHVIDNNGTIEDLILLTREILIKENIINA